MRLYLVLDTQTCICQHPNGAHLRPVGRALACARQWCPCLRFCPVVMDRRIAEGGVL